MSPLIFHLMHIPSVNIMVFYEEPKRGVSSGALWQDSAVSASRLTEKYIHQEEQFLHLSEQHTSSQVEYDRNGPNSQLRITESACDSLNFPSAKTGALPGTGYIYRFVGGKLWLWDSQDKSGNRSCEFTPSRFDIVSVGVAESRDPACKFWLIIATLFEVSLFYFDPDTVSPDSLPVPSGYVAVTGGSQISTICPPNGLKRIFIASDQGSVFELVYNLAPPSSGSAVVSSVLGTGTNRRCYLSIIHRPFAARLPSTVHSVVRSASMGHIRSLQVDACRQLLFAVANNNSLLVFSLNGTPSLAAELGDHQIRDSVKAALKASAWTPETDACFVVDAVPVNPHTGGDILCVLVTRGGVRIFVKGVKSGYYSIGTLMGEVKTTNCRHCDRNKMFLSHPHALTVAAAKIPERHTELCVESAFSPDSGRSIIMVSSRGLAVIRPDESCLVQRQAAPDARFQLRERFDLVPVAGKMCAVALLMDPPGPKQLQSIAPLDSLLTVASDELGGGLTRSWRFVVTTMDREIVVSPIDTCGILVELLKSKNLYAIRDFALQWRPEQLAALLLSVVGSGALADEAKSAMAGGTDSFYQSASAFGGEEKQPSSQQLVERILFAPETASALGLIDLPGLAAAAGARGEIPPMGPLGTVVQTQAQQVSARTRGIAILVSRLVRPVWFAKAFAVEMHGEFAVVTPGLKSSQRTFVQALLRPLVATLTRYRYQLSEGPGETKLVEGFIVLVNALVETMELMRLVETGQLNRRGLGETAGLGQDAVSILDAVNDLTVRDIAMSAGVGEPVLIELLNREAIDLALVKKHCPLIVPK